MADHVYNGAVAPQVRASRGVFVANRRSKMEIRPVRPTDAPLVFSLAIDRDSQLASDGDWPVSSGVGRTLSRAVLPLSSGGRSWIARDRRGVALIEVEPRDYVIGCDVTRLVVRGDAQHLLPPLFGAVAENLQYRGIPRLFARCDERAKDVLRSFDFQELATEVALLGPDTGQRDSLPLPHDGRYRMPSDDWPLHQLEMECTPSLVRQFEGLASLNWANRQRGQAEIVVEREGKLVAWIAWGSRVHRGMSRVSMLLRPECKDLGPVLLGHALKDSPPGRRFVARARNYHADVVRAYLDAGFEIVKEETVMVKHAGVELAPVERMRMRVTAAPTLQTLPFKLGARRKSLAGRSIQ